MGNGIISGQVDPPAPAGRLLDPDCPKHGGSIFDITEADESATSKGAALRALEAQFNRRESEEIIAMYERAAWGAGATVAETEELFRARPKTK